MTKQIPFVKREEEISRRGGYSTNISSRYEGWSGLYDKHGQCTMILVEYD